METTTKARLCARERIQMFMKLPLLSFYPELYEKDFSGQTAIYWEVKYPFPLSNRDVSFLCTRKHARAYRASECLP